MGALPTSPSTPTDSGIVTVKYRQGDIANPYGFADSIDTGSGRTVSSQAITSNPYARQQAQLGSIYQLDQPQRNAWFNSFRY